jgi:outer membrane protein W
MRNRYRFPMMAIVIYLLFSSLAYGQVKRRKLPKFNKNKESNVFLRKQWWLGFKAGANLSSAHVTQRYSPISPTNYPAAQTDKKYDGYSKLGIQATLEVTFYFSGLSLSFQPTYRNNRFTYENEYHWADGENPNDRLDLKYEQLQSVTYLDFPLMAKYEFTKNKISPYVQAGVYTSTLIDATKSVTVSGVDYASGGTNEFKNETIIVGASDLFAKNHWGFLGGVGVYYNLGNVRLNADFILKGSSSNITSTKNRFSNERLSGVGDTMDDMKLNNMSFTIGCLFPLRFLGKSFQSVEKN